MLGNMKVTLDQVIEAVKDDNNIGFCVNCGAEAFGVEPDARGYMCEACGEANVFGAEELLLILASQSTTTERTDDETNG